jgi:hypothetical protein
MAFSMERMRFPVAGTGALARHAALELRAFGGVRRDLDLDLETRGRGPEIVTELLCASACQPGGGAVGADELWALPVGRRMEVLLRLAALAGGEMAQATMRCPACAETLEAEFSLLELAELSAARAETPVEVRRNGETLRLRRPTGADQRRWATSTSGDDDDAKSALAMLEDLREPGSGPAGPLDASWLPAVDAAMSELDPLVDFSLSTTCSDCGAACTPAVDLEALALARLRAAQRELLDTVHRLALAYHWTEAEILELPAWRRARYVELVERTWR